MKQGKITITSLLISFLIGSFIILGFTSLFGDLANQYGVSLTDNENELKSLNMMNETYSKAQSFQSNTQTSEISFGESAGLNIVNILNVFRQFFDIFTIQNQLVSDAIKIVGLPIWFNYLLNGIILIVILGLVLAYLRGLGGGEV